MNHEDVYCIAVEDPMALKYYREFLENLEDFDHLAYRVQNGKRMFLLCSPKVDKEDLIDHLKRRGITPKELGCFDKNDHIYRLSEKTISDEISIEEIRLSELDDLDATIKMEGCE